MKTTCIVYRAAALVLALAGALAHSTSSNAAAPLPGRPTNSVGSKIERDRCLEWNLKTLVGAYEQVGKKNPKWDAAARRALTEFAHIRAFCPGTERMFELRQATQEAISAGCNDPMIAYLLAYGADAQLVRSNLQAHVARLRNVADRLCESDYPAARKLWAAYRAGRRDKPHSGSELSRQGVPYRLLVQRYLVEILEDQSTPTSEILDVVNNCLDGFPSDDASMARMFKAIEPAARKHSTNAFFHHLVKGVTYIEYAWNARGSGYSDTVTDEGWKLFAERLKVAATELEAAWKLNPDEPLIATTMLTVEKGMGGERADMEKWFRRAMQADPDNNRACLSKLDYLEPKWHGSAEEMLAFARQCAASTNYGGRTPLILFEAHESLARYLTGEERKQYWKQPGIWKEVKAAFDKYFRATGSASTTDRSRLLNVAYRTGQWEEFVSLHSEMKAIDYNVFEGKERFDKILAYVNTQVTQAKNAR